MNSDKQFINIPLSKKDINSLIMNYLSLEGFQQAALTFKKESNTQLRIILIRARGCTIIKRAKPNKTVHH